MKALFVTQILVKITELVMFIKAGLEIVIKIHFKNSIHPWVSDEKCVGVTGSQTNKDSMTIPRYKVDCYYIIV